MLTDQQIARYSRQIILSGVGGQGQQKLLASRVMVVGAGTQSLAAALYLVAAGVGTLRLVTPDGPGMSEDTVRALVAVNPECRVGAEPWHPTDCGGLVDSVDLTLDAANDAAISISLLGACLRLHKPMVWGYRSGAAGFIAIQSGHLTSSPCYPWRHLDMTDHDATDDDLILASVTAGLVGSVQATEGIALLLGIGSTPASTILLCDMRRGEVRVVPLHRDRTCVRCHSPGAERGSTRVG